MSETITFSKLMEVLKLNKNDEATLREIIRLLSETNKWEETYELNNGELVFTKEQQQEIISKYKRNEKRCHEICIKTILDNIDEKMSDEQKYKVIYDWFVDKCRYDYSILDEEKAQHYAIESFNKFRNIIRQYARKIDAYQHKTKLEQAESFIEALSKETEYQELINLKQKERQYLMSAENFKKNAIRYREGDIFLTYYGVCQNFAEGFKEICDRVGLASEIIYGNILSDGIECGHAWNAIVVDDEVKFVDISGAIHSKDGTYVDTQPDDFFNVSINELEKIDNGKCRTINNESKMKIKTLESKLNSKLPAFD